jgi:hypothetical protein
MHTSRWGNYSCYLPSQSETFFLYGKPVSFRMLVHTAAMLNTNLQSASEYMTQCSLVPTYKTTLRHTSEDGGVFVVKYGWKHRDIRWFFNRAITTPSHCAIIGHNQGRSLGLHSDTPSSARSNVWRPGSTDASYARSISSPKMKSFVILTTNTQILSGHLPRVNFRITSFKMGWASPDTFCSV